MDHQLSFKLNMSLLANLLKIGKKLTKFKIKKTTFSLSKPKNIEPSFIQLKVIFLKTQENMLKISSMNFFSSNFNLRKINLTTAFMILEKQEILL